MVAHYPKIEPDAFWGLLTDLDKRMEWDKDRWVQSKRLGEEAGGNVLHVVGPKPPVPMVSARDFCMIIWKDETFGEGKRAQYCTSTEHADA